MAEPNKQHDLRAEMPSTKGNEHERKGMISSTDYEEIAKLTNLLNSQITRFVHGMNSLGESIPCQDAFADIFEGHTRLDNELENPTGDSINPISRNQGSNETLDYILGDESMVQSSNEAILNQIS